MPTSLTKGRQIRLTQCMVEILNQIVLSELVGELFDFEVPAHRVSVRQLANGSPSEWPN
jgi:hypothetical protein